MEEIQAKVSSRSPIPDPPWSCHPVPEMDLRYIWPCRADHSNDCETRTPQRKILVRCFNKLSRSRRPPLDVVFRAHAPPLGRLINRCLHADGPHIRSNIVRTLRVELVSNPPSPSTQCKVSRNHHTSYTHHDHTS